MDGAASGLDADLLDGLTPAEVAALGGGGAGITTAQAIAAVLPVILAGTNITIDRTTDGQITITGQAGGGTGLTEAQVDARITLLAALLAGATFTGAVAGIAPTADAHFATKAYVDNLVNPVQDHNSYVGISANASVTEAEFLAGTAGMGNALDVPVYTGTQYIGFARPASEGTITQVYVYAESSPNTTNQIGAWTVETAELDISGTAHIVVRSNNALTPPIGYTLVVEVV